MTGPEPRPWIKQLDVYVGGKSKTDGAVKCVKLSSNESALGTSPKALDAYHAEAKNLHRYPDASYHDLRAALAAKYDIEAEQILCGIGSDEVLKLACRAYLAPGDEVIFPRHSFMMYPIAAASYGGVPVEVDDVDYTANVDNMLAAVTDRTRIVFLANPNNPTGTVLSSGEVERLWRGLPDHVLLVIDGAYAEFIENEDYQDGIALVKKSKNVLMTRTFSKLYGLAALRLGWGYSCPEVAQILDSIRDPFNVPSATQVAGVAAIQDSEFETRARKYNSTWRAYLRAELIALGLDPVPSAANFILIRFPDTARKSAEAANDFLLSHGYILRWLPGQGLQDCLRLTVGTEEENKAVIQLLRDFMEQDT
ncbi:histidinol-phosphate transaminase [Paremcibacter congregatus]|uniref:histidinol-phosphate transaminase n=1 Tax=Paremcibacter congregatus TaxID=2043170 RepID=UPI0030EB68E2|tara:strand:- start:661 stop:1758 length:1098 start_codon:yes stop_codon:yes gene_type:complete